MKYGEELRFLGGLYDAVRGTYNTADSLIQFENKIDVAVEKDILSETTAYGIKKILPQNQKESIENLIDSIMNEDEPSSSHSSKSINIDKFGEELKYLGKLYETIEKENLGRSQDVLMKYFAQKIDISVNRGVISKETANSIKQTIGDRNVDELIVSVMNDGNGIRGRKPGRDSTRTTGSSRPTPTISSDPCCSSRSSYGRSPC